TPLHLAVYHRQTACVRALLESDKVIDLKDGQGKTALHIAAGGDYWEGVEALMEGGACLDIQDGQGRLVLDYARQKNAQTAITMIS
ncbi:hypothetical protein GUITHDRAFT_53744, partial [Guillardia theta CCMP2712]